jgi:hypothetical protein
MSEVNMNIFHHINIFIQWSTIFLYVFSKVVAVTKLNKISAISVPHIYTVSLQLSRTISQCHVQTSWLLLKKRRKTFHVVSKFLHFMDML